MRRSFATHSLVLSQLILLTIQEERLPCMLPNLCLVVTTKRNNGHLSSITTSYILTNIIIHPCFKLFWRASLLAWHISCGFLMIYRNCMYSVHLRSNSQSFNLQTCCQNVQLPNKLHTTFCECIIVLFAFSSCAPLSYCVVYTL